MFLALIHFAEVLSCLLICCAAMTGKHCSHWVLLSLVNLSWPQIRTYFWVLNSVFLIYVYSVLRITVVITVASVPRVGKQLPHVIPASPVCSMLQRFCAHLQGLRLDKGVPQALLSVLLPVAGLMHTGRSLAQSDLAHLLSWKKQWHCQTSPHSLQFLLLGSTVKSYLVHIQTPLMSFSGSWDLAKPVLYPPWL